MVMTKFDNIMIGLILAAVFSQIVHGIYQLYIFTGLLLGWSIPSLTWKIYEKISHNKEIYIRKRI